MQGSAAQDRIKEIIGVQGSAAPNHFCTSTVFVLKPVGTETHELVAWYRYLLVETKHT